MTHDGMIGSFHTENREAGETQVDVSWLLAESRRLLDRAIVEHDTRRQGGFIRICPDDRWERNLQHLLQRVREEAVLAVACPLRMKPSYQASHQLVSEHLEAGKQIRLLYSPGYAETRDHRSLVQQTTLEAQIKVANADFHNMVIVDRKIAAIWGDEGRQHPYGFVISDPDLLRAIHQFATLIWASAPRLSAHLGLRREGFDEMSLAVLRALNLGLKDEVAARRLLVSLRTYRRHVAGIMVRLGVTTRFQIGARAAELGLLSSGATAFDPSRT
ncbi:hypothetical protein AB4Z09_02125 [Rhodococcus sp. TAF43]|uniref:hypothetical protein n=1 Tax=unclassified Rhodococcus (in: high G+C Gram-positive bacteria) TaxID=192944 RepID=UPI0015830CBB|nr:hypothetical protein [Rhodococcus sp. W8901]QKT10883.1 hypothetical protein HUN07_09295 [Rhodococcus sp. W8901]